MPDGDLGPAQQEMVRLIELAIGQSTRTVQGHIDGLRADLMARLDGLVEQNAADQYATVKAVSEARVEIVAGLDVLDGEVSEGLDHLEHIEDEMGIEHEDEEQPNWRDTADLIAPGKVVFGYHCGGGSDPRIITGAMGRGQQVDTIYWQSLQSPADACARMIGRGTIPRLELELIRALCNAGAKAQDENGSIWHRMAEGQYDGVIVFLLESVASLGRPIILSWGHESDYSSEQGAHPKGSDRPEDQCGTPEEFREAWVHIAALARVHAPNARLFLNLGGGYKGAGEPGGKWDRMWPGEDHVDFFGWDAYNWYGVGGSTDWGEFEERGCMFGRWDWTRRNCPNTPLIVGEFGTCEGPGGDKDAGKWLLAALDFIGAHPYVPGEGGFAHAIYFSVAYDTHTRQLDDGGQKEAVLPAIGAHPALAWAD